MGAHDKHKINALLDKLTLESLSLMEQHIHVKIELEKCLEAGEGHISKTRYIMGHQQVTKLQLPNEDCKYILPMAVANYEHAEEDVISSNRFDLEFRPVTKRTEDTKYEDGIVINPITWFGLLVPQSLHSAQHMFKQSLHWSFKAINIQQRLSDCLDVINKLNNLINKE